MKPPVNYMYNYCYGYESGVLHNYCFKILQTQLCIDSITFPKISTWGGLKCVLCALFPILTLRIAVSRLIMNMHVGIP